jgi:predicted glycogen debranching enzyme
VITFGPDVTKGYARSSQLEWLLANGLGGYSSSTVAGSNTRRYHGLLVAALSPPGKRTLLLQKLEETLAVSGKPYHLSVNEYPNTLYPTGHNYLEKFNLDPFPIFRYRAGSATLEKEVCLVHGENTVILQYRLTEGNAPVKFSADLLVNYRDFHSLTKETTALSFKTEKTGSALRIIATQGATPFYVFSDRAEFEETGYWYRNFIYAEERERGQDYQEDAFSPGRLVAVLRPGESINIAVSASRTSLHGFSELISKQKSRIRALARGVDDDFLHDLLRATDVFLVRKNGEVNCIAGYHWFGGWGRDTMISFTGIALVPKRFHEAKLILQTFARNMRYGLIPNYFAETDGSPQYNALDATLWFFHAVRKYFQYTRDVSTIRELYPSLRDSAQLLSHGTIFDAKVDDDLLLNIGEAGMQTTWMDAKIGDFVVTPRNGKAVEINALWYWALDSLSAIAMLLGKEDEQARYAKMAEDVKTAFSRTFWNSEAGCLFDRIVSGRPDTSFRANQIMAVALPKSILPVEMEKSVVRAVQLELLVPIGLRTLSPRDLRYHGHYEGDQNGRDLAYHQGPAWPWLLGQFVTAYIKISNNARTARRTAMTFLEPLRRHLHEAGLGFISELFDGEPPYRPRGCIAQAWSVAEILRAYWEDILGKCPQDTLLSYSESDS